MYITTLRIALFEQILPLFSRSICNFRTKLTFWIKLNVLIFRKSWSRWNSWKRWQRWNTRLQYQSKIFFPNLIQKSQNISQKKKSIEITLNESTNFPTEIFPNCLHLVQFYFALKTVQNIALCIGFCCCWCSICKIVFMFKLNFRCKWKKWCRWKRW